jgi:site-specific DNA-methyltransferase (adenine-specific)
MAPLAWKQALEVVMKACDEGGSSIGTYAVGNGFRLHAGDCRTVMASMPSRSVDLIFADPPYFLSNGGFTCRSGRRAPVRKGDWDRSAGQKADYDFTVSWLSACQRLLKPNGTLWVSGTQHVIFSVGFALQQLGFKLLNTITWYKPNASPNLSCRYFTHSTELILWAAPPAKGKLLHTFNYGRMKAENNGKQMRDVWNLPASGDEEVSDDGRGRIWSLTSPRKSEKALGRHPTQKPLALLKRIIDSSSQPDDVVLDPFSGSGTTGVAALELGRRYWGIELDRSYLHLSERRLRELSPLKRSA